MLAVIVTAVGIVGLLLMYQGLGIAGTTVWGYNDSEAGFYIAFGAFLVSVGSVVLFVGFLLGLRIAREFFPARAEGDDSPRRPLFRLALGATLTVAAFGFLAFSVVAGLATPSDTSRIDVSILVLSAFAIAAAFGGLAIQCFRE